MHTLHCAGCGLPLQSDVSEEEMLEEIQQTDPTVGQVTILCHCCMALEAAANPATDVCRPEDESTDEE